MNPPPKARFTSSSSLTRKRTSPRTLRNSESVGAPRSAVSTPSARSAFSGGGQRLRMLPAGRASRYRSYTTTSCPALSAPRAAAMPAGPAPRTATRPGGRPGGEERVIEHLGGLELNCSEHYSQRGTVAPAAVLSSSVGEDEPVDLEVR